MEKIKVLFLADNLSYGGAQKMLTFVANNIDRGCFSAFIHRMNPNTNFAQKLNDDVTLFDGSEHKRRGIRRFEELADFIKTINKVKPNVIVSFLIMPNFIASAAGFLKGVPVVISERGDPGRNMSFSDKLMRRIECCAKGAVFQTDGARKIYPPALQKVGKVIPNPVTPVTLEKPYEYGDSIQNIGFVGRFELVQKRQDIAIKALAEVLKHNEGIKLHFFGSGPDEDKCKQIAKELSIEENVLFHGRVSNPSNELLNMDMYVISSDYEGIPNSLIEAMAVGLPCVATKCTPGGAELLITDGVNGLLAERGDSKSLAEAMGKFINNTELARKCGENAKKITETFNPAEIITMWNEYLKKIAK